MVQFLFGADQLSSPTYVHTTDSLNVPFSPLAAVNCTVVALVAVPQCPEITICVGTGPPQVLSIVSVPVSVKWPGVICPPVIVPCLTVLVLKPGTGSNMELISQVPVT